MNRTALFLAGLIAAVVVLIAACGGEEAAPTATKAPAPTATRAPAPTATRAPAPAATTAPAPTATKAPAATPAPAATVAPPAAAAAASLEISAKGDALEFNKNKLSAKAGVQVVLVFNNVSAINQHNWVIVQAGAKDNVATRGVTAGPTNNWVQSGDSQVIANTPLVDPGKKGEVRFAAPPAGRYQFVCTFPGHNFTMFGDFEVTP